MDYKEQIDNAINKKTNFDYIVLPIIWGVLCIYMFSVLGLFIYYRDRPQMQYRGIPLTLLYGFSVAVYVLLLIAAKIFSFQCITKLWIHNIFIVILLHSILSRGVRVILLWKLNKYKVSKMGKIKIVNYDSQPEANIYFRALHKLVDKEIAKKMILFPILIDIVITGIVHYNFRDDCRGSPFAFLPLMLYLSIFTLTFPYITYQLHQVKEYHTVTTEMEYILATIFFIIVGVIYAILKFVPSLKYNDNVIYYTFDGVFLFAIHSFITFIIFLNNPFFEMYKDQKNLKKYKMEMTMESFYRTIKDPLMLEELKKISISEFSIENVLFWESYRELLKLVKSEQKKNSGQSSSSGSNLIKLPDVITKYQKFKKGYSYANSDYRSHHHKYSYSISSKNSSYSTINLNNLNDLNYSNSSRNDEISDSTYTSGDINIDTPLSPNLKVYYINFYRTFIEYNAPATVNISSSIREAIEEKINKNPTVDIFDEAKDEILSTMFRSLYPKLLLLLKDKGVV